MPQETIRAILLDIEGTTTPISFVHDVLFPYSREHLTTYLEQHAGAPELLQDLAHLGSEYRADISNDQHPPPLVEPYVYWLIDRDRKSPALKSIQGKIWEQGYNNGSLRSPIFDDVLKAFAIWQRSGISINIFSSGSVLAQKLLFGHTEAGDLRKYIDHYFDTTIGTKLDSSSYQRIASSLSLLADEVLFISDVVSELEAAKTAGMKTLLCIRPGNPVQPHSESWHSTRSLLEV